jgi:UDP-N-acetylglucosamine acyltransferase
MCTGTRAQLLGLNLVGLERNGFDKAGIEEIQKIYNIYFTSGIVPKKALELLKAEIESGPILDRFIDFIAETKRGIISQ